MATAALKSTDAANRLDQEIAAIRGFVGQNRGEIRLMERARGIKILPPGIDGRDPLFDSVQRLIVTLLPDAAMDVIVQRLVELGMDRFGDNLGDSRFNQRRAIPS